MKLNYAIFVFLFVSNVYSQLSFIGQGTTQLYFHFHDNYKYPSWIQGLDYCHERKLMPGTIESEYDLALITKYLKGEDIEALWIAATDHRVEGLYEWLSNGQEIKIGNWSTGMPGNRSANCLILTSDGFWEEEWCGRAMQHFTLCALPTLNWGKIEPSNSETKQPQIDALIGPPVDSFYLKPIGEVNGKSYFVEIDENQKRWVEALDLCHSYGMKLASPESKEELQFLQTYAIEHAEQFGPFHLAGSDIMSISCSKGNTEFRWFYTRNSIGNDTLMGNSNHYKCVILGSSGMWASDCIAATFSTICELN